MPTKLMSEGYDNENSDEENFRNAKTYMPDHLSDKVDDIFSFVGRLEVVLSFKHFRLAATTPRPLLRTNF